MARFASATLLGLLSVQLSYTSAFSSVAFLPSTTTATPALVGAGLGHRTGSSLVNLGAKASKKKKKSGGGGAASGIKGFGSATTSKKNDVVTDRSKEARAFYDFLEKNGAGDNLKRVALGNFATGATEGDNLRGIVALKDIKKGDVIIRIPYEVAVNLGSEGGDPTLPAVPLLQQYCETFHNKKENKLSSSDAIDRTPYFQMLPEYKGADCMGSTDFFSDEALEAMQAPLVMKETLARRKKAKNRFAISLSSSPPSTSFTGIDEDDPFGLETPLSPSPDESNDSDDSPPEVWTDGTTTTPLTEDHLKWAMWLITSRVLTVQGDADENKNYRLLIPLLDMCNHDRASTHVLTGRAVPGGELKVVAGSPIQIGDQISICYGGGVAGNDRFLQDYGFLDSEAGFDIVALQLAGKRRVVEGSSGARKIMALSDRKEAMEALNATSLEEDKDTLAKETDPCIRSAIEYRIGVKTALAKYVQKV